MKINHSNIYLATLAFLLPCIVFAETPIYERNTYFPSVAQGHSRICTPQSSPQLTMYNNTKIKGTNRTSLHFCATNKNDFPIDGCEDTGGSYTTCSITKTNSLDIPLPTFKKSSSKNSSKCNNGGSYTFNNSSYKDISSNKYNCSFIMNNSEQRIKKLALNGGTLTIHSGDYWVESLHINSTSQIYIEGDVRLFVKNGLGIYNNSFIKKNTGSSFSLYSYNNIHLSSDASIEGDVYTSNNLVLDSTSHIIGRTLSEDLRLNSRAYIEDSDSTPLPPVRECNNDEFNNADLTGRWITSSSSGTFTPHVVNGRLQLTEAKKNQSTASSFQYRFPSAGNKIEIEFDYMAHGGGTTGADGLAIVFSDFKKTPQAGAFGGPLGYGFKQYENKPGFNGGWLGVSLDEYGNYSREGGSKNHTPSSSTAQSIVLRGSGDQFSGFNYIEGKKVNTDIDNNTGKNKVHRYRITIDSTKNNKANVTVERSIVNKGKDPVFAKVIGPINVLKNQYNQADVPENFLLSLTGSTGSATNIHEIDNFKVCALEMKPVGKQIDHFEFDHSAIGSTCNTSDITLRACADPTCSTLFTDDISVTLNSNTLGGDGFWEGGNQIMMRNGIAGLSLGKSTAGTANLDVSGSTPSTKPFSHTLCRINGKNPSVNNCTIEFKEDGLTLKIPDKLANKPVTATLQGCSQYSYTGFRTIEVTSNYITPTKGELKNNTNGEKPQVTVFDGSTWLPIDATTPAKLSLNFINNQAQFQVNYPDAGKLQLNAKDTQSYSQPVGFGSFVSFPIGLSVSVTDSSGSSSNSLCSPEDITCSIFARAGENFLLNVKAHAWVSDTDTNISNNLVTSNYAQNSLTLNHTLVAPSQRLGGSSGTLLANTYNHKAIKSSVNTINQSISEVGVFNISVTPPPSYLGSNTFQIKAANTGSIGRFIPAYFGLSAPQPTITNACGSYTYMGQTFEFNSKPTLELIPLSYTGEQIKNYSIGSWWRYNNTWDLRTYSALPSKIDVIDADTTSILGKRSGFAVSGNVVRLTGENKVQLQNAELRYRKAFAPISPTSDTITLTLNADDLKDQDNVCYKTSINGNCLPYPFPITPEHRQEWGRITMEDAYGSELNSLTSRIQTESYIGGHFIRNTDSCTTLAMSNFSFDVGNDASELPVGEQTTAASLADTSVSNGVTSMNFTAPGTGGQGQVVPTLSLLNLPWLQQDQDNNNSFEDSIKATIHFGIYRGSDRIIWSHEQNN